MHPKKEIWKGHQMFFPGSNFSSQRTVLLHRNGMLPYIPVTRRQYLAHCIKHVPEVLASFYEPLSKMSDDDKKAAEKFKEMAIKAKQRYQDELEKTVQANLVDSPAVVFEMHPYVEGQPIFITTREGGKMLVTENPAYIRKDLPKYVPQFFIVYWTIDPGAPGDYLRKRIEEYFPIEKLQAMIDK